MKKFLLILMSIILLVGASFGLVYGITNFNKLSFNVGNSENKQQTNDNVELVNKYKKEIESLNENISQLNSQINSLQTGIDENERQIENLTSQKNSLEKQIDGLNVSEKENTQKIADLNTQILTLNTQIEEKTAECQSLESQKTSLNSQIAELQSKVSYYENLLSGFDFLFVYTPCDKNIGGRNVWYDGDNIYYSYSYSQQYVYDKETNTWVDKTWGGDYYYLYGEYVWTDGENLYSSCMNHTVVLDRETQSWNLVTFSGLDGVEMQSGCVWSDGDDVYYSYDSNQYVFDKETKDWKTKTWEGFTSIYGNYICSYNDVIYYTGSSSIYELNKETDTWVLSDKCFRDLINEDGTRTEDCLSFGPQKMFVCKDKLYFIEPNVGIYVFDFVNNGWVRLLDTYFPTGLMGYDLWTDGNKSYFSLEVGSIGGGNWHQYEFVVLNND